MCRNMGRVPPFRAEMGAHSGMAIWARPARAVGFGAWIYVGLCGIWAKMGGRTLKITIAYATQCCFETFTSNRKGLQAHAHLLFPAPVPPLRRRIWRGVRRAGWGVWGAWGPRRMGGAADTHRGPPRMETGRLACGARPFRAFRALRKIFLFSDFGHKAT